MIINMLPNIYVARIGRFAAVVAAILAGTVSVFGQYLEINTVGGQTGSSGTNWTLSDNGTVVTITTSGTAVIHPSVLENALNNGRQVVVDGSHQEFTIASDVAKTSGGAARLTLKAKQYIVLSSNVDITSTSGALDLIFWADSGSWLALRRAWRMKTNRSRAKPAAKVAMASLDLLRLKVESMCKSPMSSEVEEFNDV
jgi:hypothetical protein